MAKTTHTFEFFGPLDDIVEQFTGTDTIDASAPNVILRKTVDIEDSIFADAKMEYESKHWIYVGSGDQVLTSAPFIELSRNASLSTGTNGTLVDLPWDNENSKNSIVHSNSTDPENITIVTGGRYNIFGMVRLNNDLLLSAIRVVLLVNNSIVMDVNVASLTGGETSVPVNNSLVLSTDDVVKIQIASIGVGSVSVVTGDVNTYFKIVAA